MAKAKILGKQPMITKLKPAYRQAGFSAVMQGGKRAKRFRTAKRIKKLSA